MYDPGAEKIFVEASILTTTIRLHTFNFGVEKEFYIYLKTEKNMFNIGFKKMGKNHVYLVKSSMKLT
jgi:hypothetical protein